MVAVLVVYENRKNSLANNYLKLTGELHQFSIAFINICFGFFFLRA